MALGEEQIAEFCALIKAYSPANANYQAMPPSAEKTYARAYFDAKTDAGKQKRLAWIVDKLNKNSRYA